MTRVSHENTYQTKEATLLNTNNYDLILEEDNNRETNPSSSKKSRLTPEESDGRKHDSPQSPEPELDLRQREELVSSKDKTNCGRSPDLGELSVQNNGNNLVQPKVVTKTNIYRHQDQGPFVVLIETLNITPNLKPINDIKIGKLMKAKRIVKDIIEMKVTGRHKVKIIFSNKETANMIINDKNLVIENLKSYIPDQFVQRIGIVKHLDTDLTEEEMVENFECKNNIKVKSICRFFKNTKDDYNKDKKIALTTVKITFEGQMLPDEIEIYNVKRKVFPYLFTVTQCFSCCRFGHTKKNCKNKRKNCINCGEEAHTEGTEKCKNVSKCVNCKASHRSTDKECAEFIRQSAIKKLMSLNNLSYWEANEKFPKTSNHFNVLEHLEDFPDLPTLDKNQNKMFNKEITDTNRMYHITYKQKTNKRVHDWNKPRIPYFNLPEDEEFSPTNRFIENPLRTSEIEKLKSEVKGIQDKMKVYTSLEDSNKHPGTLDDLLIDIGVYLKTSLDFLTNEQNSELSTSRK